MIATDKNGGEAYKSRKNLLPDPASNRLRSVIFTLKSVSRPKFPDALPRSSEREVFYNEFPIREFYELKNAKLRIAQAVYLPLT